MYIDTHVHILYVYSLYTHTHTHTHRVRERDKRDRERERERREERGREDAETFMCTHICAPGPLILSRHPLVKRRESTAGVPSAKFRALTAEKRAKETGDAPTNRLEITATMPSNFALVRLGQHQLALGHSARQLPRKR
jgi:hypothetical protein